MPKKKHNAYFYFMLDYKRREEAKGRRFRGLEEVAQVAGPIWKNMDARKRAPYVEKEKLKDERPVERLNTHGVPLSVITAQERSVESRAVAIRKRVESMITKAAEDNTLERLEFYFISFGYFCVLSGGRYVPAEMGVVRYSLEGGVMDTLHMLINPGPLPVGMSLEAKTHTENFHQLPLPPDALGEENFETIANLLLTFLKSSGKSLPLLFTDRRDIPHVESILNDILDAEACGLDVKVCALAEMFFLLKKIVLYYSLSLPEGFPSESIPQMLLDRDIYSYTPDISCEYHEEQENGINCSLSRCIRWAYIISDSCCLDLHIDMLPGKHIPKNSVSQSDAMSIKNESLSKPFSKNDAIPFMGSSSSKYSTLNERATSESCPSGGSSLRSGFGADFINLEPVKTVTSGGETSTLSEDSMPTSGSMYSRNMIHPVLGLGRGRRIEYDNTPPVVSNRKSFK